MEMKKGRSSLSPPSLPVPPLYVFSYLLTLSFTLSAARRIDAESLGLSACEGPRFRCPHFRQRRSAS